MNLKRRRFATILPVITFITVFTIAGCGSSSSNSDNSLFSLALFGQSGSTYPVTLLQTTDVHMRASGVGRFNTYTPMDTTDGDAVQGGYARLAAKIKEVRAAKTAAGNQVLTVDSGDYSSGSLYNMTWKSDPAAFRFIQMVGYDAITIGNHEFDYKCKNLGLMINNAIAGTGGFTVPIVASNLVFDGVTGTNDDDLETLRTNGTIVPYLIKELPNGLKIGFMGLMGDDAYSTHTIPLAAPVTVRNDYEDADKAFIQGIVNDLKGRGANVVIAISHSGIHFDAGSPDGDDVKLAENITGIDIIASGHDHTTTTEVVDVANKTTGHITHIICAGVFGTNLAQLDFTATRNGVRDLTIANHAIDDTVAGDSEVNSKVEDWNTYISTLIGRNLSDEIVANGMFDFDLNGFSNDDLTETALGDLETDAERWAGTTAGINTIAICGESMLRSDFPANEQISFADAITMIPLGASPIEATEITGAPLLKVYLTPAEIYNICTFKALVAATGYYSGNYIHISGIKYTYTGATVNHVYPYAWNDYTCKDAASAVELNRADTTTLLPVIVDCYVFQEILSATVQGLLNSLSIPLHPKKSDGTLITEATMADVLLDKDAGTPGVQEYFPWAALTDFIEGPLAKDIPDDPYETHNERILAE